MLRLILALCLLCPPGITATSENMGLDVTRANAGSMTGIAGMYGYPDPFNSFRNPATLSLQENKVVLATGYRSMMEGVDQYIPLAVSYMGSPKSGGTWGVAVMGGHVQESSFDICDLAGNITGKVSPITDMGKLTLAYQISRYTFGVNAGAIMENYGDKGFGISGLTETLFDAGVLVQVGSINLGGALGIQGGQPAAAFKTVLLGGSWQFDGVIRGALDMEVEKTLDPGDGSAVPPQRSLIGVLWKAHKVLDLGIGLAVGDPNQISFGLASHLNNASFTYSVGMPLGVSPGLIHHAGLSWAFGGERKYEESTEVVAPVQAIVQPIATPSGDKPTLAIADLDAQGVSASDAAVIADMFRTELVKQGYFSVIEKSNMEKVLSEQSFQQTGCTSSECAVKIGKILNARYLIVGSFGKLMGQYIISFRMVDVETANVVYSDNAKKLSDQDQVSNAISQMATRLGKAMKLKK